MPRRLTLIAGSGSLVPLIAGAARQHGDVLQVIDIVGRGDVAGDVTKLLPLSQAATLVEAVKSFKTTHMVLAGAVRISDSDREAVARAFGIVGRLAGSLGDVGFGAMIVLYCRLIGVKLVGPHEVAPELLAEAGLIAGPPLDAGAMHSAGQALHAARAVGAIDLGQSIVLSGDRPIAAEDAEGTDALLLRVKGFRDSGLAGNGTAPLILAKALKPKQPRFADLPAVGVTTIRNAAAAGVTIVAVEAGRSIVLDRAELVAEAKKLGVSVIGLKVGNG